MSRFDDARDDLRQSVLDAATPAERDKIRAHWRKEGNDAERELFEREFDLQQMPAWLVAGSRAGLALSRSQGSPHRSVALADAAGPLLAEAELRDDAGHLLAKGSGTFTRSRIALTEEIGYAAPGRPPN